MRRRRTSSTGSSRTCSRPTPGYQQARRDVEPGVVGMPLEDWSEPLASAVRARAGEPIPVRFALRADSGLSGIEGALAVRVAGKAARDLAFAAPSELRVAVAIASRGALRLPPRRGDPGLGRRRGTSPSPTSRNSGELDLVTPAHSGRRRAGAFRKTTLGPGGRRARAVIPFDVDSDGDLDLYVPASSGDRLFRNNLDGTFADITEAAGLPKATAFARRGRRRLRPGRRPDLLLCPRRARRRLRVVDNLRGGRLVASRGRAAAQGRRLLGGGGRSRRRRPAGPRLRRDGAASGRR